MTRTDRVCTAALKSADAAFDEAERIFQELPRTATSQPSYRALKHELKFQARSHVERLRTAKKFFKVALTVLFTGRAKLQFKDR
jgi:hypothetical protein